MKPLLTLLIALTCLSYAAADTLIMDKKTLEVAYALPDSVKIVMGSTTIRLVNYPPARVVYHGKRKVTYLGGTVICDRAFVATADTVQNIKNTPVDLKTKKYIYDKVAKAFHALEVVEP
ncbi:hypothetical protein LCGC14_2423290 [marine sediment metagenome]|uniref:Uncharacterized protein n=1 Tax=marine sediment metagenome TaxID=412755 RepID=A0A0F9CB74_9ZZZZ